MTVNNFDQLKSVFVGSFPDKRYFKEYFKYEDRKVWMVFQKLFNESQQDLDTLSELYQDYGIKVYRPTYDRYVCRRWSSFFKIRAPHVMSNRFLSYKNLLFYLNTVEDDCIPYYDFIRTCIEQEHDRGRMISYNPVNLQTDKMCNYTDNQWPGDQGFLLDGPTFLLAENTIFYNTKHCNTNRGIEWIKRTIISLYPDTKFIDISEIFLNHIDNQVRIYNPHLAHTTVKNIDKVQKLLRTVYPEIKVLDFSIYKEQYKTRPVFSQSDYIKYFENWLDTDDENGNIDTGSVSINQKTVVCLDNHCGNVEQLEKHELKVERINLRHHAFWGAGIDCETAVIERE